MIRLDEEQDPCTVLDIRGTHGSGKSHIVRELIKMSPPWEPVMGVGRVQPKGPTKERILGLGCKEWNVAVVGQYREGFATGGCDGIKEPAEIVKRLLFLSRRFRYVILEGVLVAHTYERYHDVARENPHLEYHFLFLDTPLELCLKRVRERNANSPRKVPGFRDLHVLKDHEQIGGNVRRKLEKAGHLVETLSHTNPMPRILELLCRNQPRPDPKRARIPGGGGSSPPSTRATSSGGRS